MEKFDFQKIPQEEGERWLKEVFATHDRPDEITEILLSHNVSVIDVIAICGVNEGRMYEIFRPAIALGKLKENIKQMEG